MSSMHSTDLTLDEINLGDPDFWLRDDISGAVVKLQRERPISWNEHPEAGRGFWNFVRYHDIEKVNRNVVVFRNREGSRLYHDPEANLVRPPTNSMSEMGAPLFEIDGVEGVDRVVVDAVGVDQVDVVSAAVTGCPVRAIRWSGTD